MRGGTWRGAELDFHQFEREAEILVSQLSADERGGRGGGMGGRRTPRRGAVRERGLPGGSRGGVCERWRWGRCAERGACWCTRKMP